MADTITFDFTNCTDTAVGEHGISDDRIVSLAERACEIDSPLSFSLYPLIGLSLGGSISIGHKDMNLVVGKNLRCFKGKSFR